MSSFENIWERKIDLDLTWSPPLRVKCSVYLNQMPFSHVSNRAAKASS